MNPTSTQSRSGSVRHLTFRVLMVLTILIGPTFGAWAREPELPEVGAMADQVPLPAAVTAEPQAVVQDQAIQGLGFSQLEQRGSAPDAGSLQPPATPLDEAVAAGVTPTSDRARLVRAGQQKPDRQAQVLEPRYGTCTRDDAGVVTCGGAQDGVGENDVILAGFESTLRGVPPAPSGPAAPTAPNTTVTVDTTSMVADGTTTSVSALLADRGADGHISFLEALTAVNNTGPGHTINFSLPHGATISFDHTLILSAGSTTINGDTNSDDSPDVVLDGPDGYVSLSIESGNNSISYLAIAGLSIEGTDAHSNQVYGCYIGTDVDGLAARSEEVNGLQIIRGAYSNTVEHNLIAGNTYTDETKAAVGLLISLVARDNLVIDNWIGVTWSGSVIPNDIGVLVRGGAYRNTIGGDRSDPSCSGPCNQVNGNTLSGIEISGADTKENIVKGNYIGIDWDGTTPEPNGYAGVEISDGAQENVIGGSRGAETACQGPCNLISGNGSAGVLMTGGQTAHNEVKGNYIGVSKAGNAPVPNGGSGVLIEAQANLNTVGGGRPSDLGCQGPCNLISGNALAGVGVLGPLGGGNEIRGNYIGTDHLGDSVSGLGNQTIGIGIVDASNNQVGGEDLKDGNRIAYNDLGGVYILKNGTSDPARRNAVRRNEIYGNGGPGIDLSPDEGIGVDGPNSDRLPPTLYPVQSSGVDHLFTGRTDAPDGSQVDIYDGGGRRYLGSTAVTGGGFSLLVAAETVNTPAVATVTDPSNNTSEYSGYGSLTLGSPHVLPGGRVYAFAVITQTWDMAPLLRSEDVTITVAGESYCLRGDGKGEDFFEDIYYSGWFTAPTTLDDYEVVLTINETPAAVVQLNVTDQPQMVILTDLQELKNEFVRTSSRRDALRIYEALSRLSEYAGKYRGILIDLQQEVDRTSATDATPYSSYSYLTAGTAGLTQRNKMGTAIDTYIHSLEPYKSTLEYLVIVGDDAVVPLFRRTDPLKIEKDYPGQIKRVITGNLTLFDSGRGYILTDIPYGSFDATDPNTVKRPPNPDMGVGRVFFSTPQALRQGIDAYETPIDLGTASSVAAGFNQQDDHLTWEYHFKNTVVRWLKTYYTVTAQTIMSTTIADPTPGHFYHFDGEEVYWQGVNVADAISKTNVTVLYSHADQFSNVSEWTGANYLFTAARVASLPLQPGSLFLDSGCHSGYPVSRPPNPAANLYGSTFSTQFQSRQITFLAPTTFGFGSNNAVEFHDRLFAQFLRGIFFDKQPRTVGWAFRSAQRLYNATRPDAKWMPKDTYARYGTGLYGLPTQCFAGRCPSPTAGNPELLTPGQTVPESSPAALEESHALDIVVDTPRFRQVVNADGTVRFELPNTGGQDSVAHYPLLPEVIRLYYLPAGATVSSVTVVSQTGSIHPDPVLLETATPVNRTSGPEPGRVPLTSTYPAEISWYGTADMGDGVVLVVGVNPMQYDPDTQLVTLYNHVELQVIYDAPASTARIAGIEVNGGDAVSIGQASLPITVTVESDLAQTLTLDWEINDAAGLPMRHGEVEVILVAGANEIGVETGTYEWHPGPMLLMGALRDLGTVIDMDAAAFVADGHSLTAETESEYYGDEITTTLTVAIYDQDGAGVPGQAAVLTATLDSAPLALVFAEELAGSYQATMTLAGLVEGLHQLNVGLPGAEDAIATFGMDQTPPDAQLEALPPGTAGFSIPISWSADEYGSGLEEYQIQYAVHDTATWTTWFTGSAALDHLATQTSAVFGPWSPEEVEDGETYFFRVRALDNVGNLGTFSEVVSATVAYNPAVEREEAVARVVELTNEQRALNGLPPLKLVGLLNDSSQGHSQDMAVNRFESHMGSDGSYPEDRMYRVGYDWIAYGENVAVGQTSPEEVVAGWMASEVHRANILDPGFTEIGVGYAYDPVSVISGTTAGYHYWTQNFGDRQDFYPLIINSEAELTASPDVSLYLYGEGWATEMMISNRADFLGASWVPYTHTLSWALEPGQGLRTVHARLRNTAAGGEAVLESSDEIILGCCLVRGADLEVAKSASEEDVVAGDLVSYTVVLTNLGPATAVNTLLADTLPGGLELESQHISQGFCTQWVDVITCDIGEMAADDVVTLTLEAEVTDAAAASLINTATVTSSTPDPDGSNNNAQAIGGVKGTRADLWVSKQDAHDPVTAGATIIYSITVTNDGPAIVDTVWLTDVLPAVVAFDTATGPGWSCTESSGTVTCEGGTLSPASSSVVEIQVTTSGTGIFTNTVTVGAPADVLDPDLENNTAMETTTAVEYLVVDTNNFDEGDSNPGDGICESILGGCTLRAAIEEANAKPGLDVIGFAALSQAILPGADLPTVTDPVIIDGTTAPGYAGTPVVQLNGEYVYGTNGLTIAAGGSTVKGLAITNFGLSGILLITNGGNTIERNYIGPEPGADFYPGNKYGVHIQDSSGNMIGPDNLISENKSFGIFVDGEQTSNNTIQGNLIGTDPSGTLADANVHGGVRIGYMEGEMFRVGGVHHTIADNLISGNGGHGIHLATSECLVEGNTIGTDISGSTALGNANDGINLGVTSFYGRGDVFSNTIRNNLVSGNGSDGIVLDSDKGYLTGTVIQGNRIGTDITGTAAIPNLHNGIVVSAYTYEHSQNLIGGLGAGDGNLISGNTYAGILLSMPKTTGNLVRGNLIGTDIYGAGELGNSRHGIVVYRAQDNTVGGLEAGAGNTIAFNGMSGVALTNSDLGKEISILSNAIYSNTQLGIDLYEDGVVNPNDPGDVDTGPNGFQNFPIIPIVAPGSAYIIGSLDSTPDTTFLLQFFANATCDPSGHGEGETYLGSAEVTTGADGIGEINLVLPVDVPLGHFVTATATDPDGNTSEFSSCTEVMNWVDMAVSKSDDPDPAFSGQALTYTITVDNNMPTAASGLVLTDTLPASVIFADASGPGWSCIEAGGQVTCDKADLPASQSASITIVVTPTLPGTITNTVQVNASEPEGIPGDNTAQETTVVDPADLAVVIYDAPDPVISSLTYTLVVTNYGPLAAYNLSLVDELPAVEFGSWEGAGWACNESGGTVTCTRLELQPMESATVTLVVNPSVLGTITDAAWVSADQGDPDTANNLAAEDTLVQPAIDLIVTAQDRPDPVLVSQVLTYTLVVSNAGPREATAVELLDVLPAQVGYLSSAPGGVCVEAGGTVTCDLGTMAAGTVTSVTIEATANALTAGVDDPMANHVTVTGAELDADLSDNSMSSATYVRALYDQYWDTRFGLPGIEIPQQSYDGGEVINDMTVGPDGRLHVVGLFAGAGASQAYDIASWDGERWEEAISQGGVYGGNPNLTYHIKAATVSDSGLVYVGGLFDGINDVFGAAVAAPGIAVWDGRHWSTLGSGIPVTNYQDGVYVLAADGTDLYVGGKFATAGGQNANNIARWDGSQWHLLGEGTNGTVTALAVDAATGDVYVGGGFTEAGGVAANRIARWDGEAWHAVGSGFDGGVADLAFDDTSGSLFAAGSFAEAGGVAANHIALWDGESWHPLGSGIGAANELVSSLALMGSDLYVGGRFSVAGGAVAANIAKWDGESWSAVGGDVEWVYGVSFRGVDLTVLGGDLLVAGDFYGIDGLAAIGVARWDGAAWSPLVEDGQGHGMGDNGVWDMAFDASGVLYAAGDFWTAGGVETHGVARWDGEAWSGLADEGLTREPLFGSIHTLAFDGGVNLYAGGYFFGIGGVPALSIAKWNGNSWSQVGDGFNSRTVDAVAVDEATGDVYAGGTFYYSDGRKYVAVWDGVSWLPMTDGTDKRVMAIAPTPGGGVYVGGYFEEASGLVVNGIAKWDGVQWSPLGSGVSEFPENIPGVRAIAVADNGDVYIGGQFVKAGGVTVNHIARWDGENWSALGSGIDPEGGVNDIAIRGEDVFVVGSFDSAGGVSAVGIAKWNGTAWTSCGSGTRAVWENYEYRGGADAVVVQGTNVYVGGWSNRLGRAPSSRIGLWHDPIFDLQLTKEHAPDPAVRDHGLVYTLTVANNGTHWATNVALTDTLPTGVTYGGAAGPSWTCDETAGVVVCDLALLGAGEETWVTISVIPTVLGTITNTAEVTADEAEDYLANNLVHEETLVVATADLALSKTSAPGSFSVGDLLTYTLTITNQGPAPAGQIHLVDTLPGEVQYEAVTGLGWACDHAAGVVECLLDDLPVGQTSVVQVGVTLLEIGTITNTAEISALEYDPDESDNLAVETAEVSLADLSVALSDSADPISIGHPFTYTVVVVNQGPSAATDLVVTDLLPAGLTFKSASGLSWDCSQGSGSVHCSGPDLQASQASTLTIVVTPTVLGTLTNRVQVNSSADDPEPLDNEAEEPTTVQLFVSDSTGIPEGWTVVNGGTGQGTAATWTDENPCGRTIGDPLSDPWLMVDSDCAGQGDEQDEQLISPVFDATSCQTVTLEFANQFRSFRGVEIGDVDVSTDGGGSWVNLLRMRGADDGYPTSASKLLDLTTVAAGEHFQIRFYYYDAHYDWWWAIDNVQLFCTVGDQGHELYLPVVLRQSTGTQYPADLHLVSEPIVSALSLPDLPVGLNRESALTRFRRAR